MTRHAASSCGCGAAIDMSAGFRHADPPKAGDVSVCAYCARVNVFAEDMALRPMSEAERAELSPDEASTIDAARADVQKRRRFTGGPS